MELRAPLFVINHRSYIRGALQMS